MSRKNTIFAAPNNTYTTIKTHEKTINSGACMRNNVWNCLGADTPT